MAEVLEPGTVIKPQMGKEKAIAWALELYGLHAIDVKEFNSYDDRNFFFKVDAAKPVDNAYIASVWQDGYTLKVTNTLDSKDPDFFEAQNGLIMHMAEADLAVPEPVKDKQGRLLSIQELPQDGKTAWEANNENVDAGKKHIVRLLKFIPGKILYDIDPWQPRHFFEAGVFAAKMDSSLRGYHHKAYDTRNCIWFLSSIPQVKNFLNAIGDEGHRNMCRDIIDAFESEVLTVQDQLESGIIHGDFNEQNILVRPIKDKPEEYEVFSVIDFGDSQKNPLVYELGIAIMYMMTQCKIIDPNEAGAHVLAGYQTVRKLPDLEWDVLRMCVAARYAQSLVMGAYSHQQDPDNDYLLVTAPTGWKNLTSFWSLSKKDLYAKWHSIIDSYN